MLYYDDENCGDESFDNEDYLKIGNVFTFQKYPQKPFSAKVSASLYNAKFVIPFHIVLHFAGHSPYQRHGIANINSEIPKVGTV